MPIEISGAQLVPPAWNPLLSGRHFWLRMDHFPAAGITVRSNGAPAGATWTVSNGTATGTSGSGPTVTVARPGGPAKLEIICRAGAFQERATLWVVRGQILFHTQGPVSSENQRAGVNAREIHRDPAHRPRLGLRTWPDTQVGGQTNYGACVEIVGVIEPAEIPIPFHLVRRTIRARTRTSDGSRLTGPRPDDTTDVDLQDTTPSRRGRVYDFDAPGSHFLSGDSARLTHEWDLVFEQALVIGPLQRGGQAFTRATAQHRVIAPLRRWRACFSAFVRTPGARPSVEMSGYVGP
jgi:hypothetical protein